MITPTQIIEDAVGDLYATDFDKDHRTLEKLSGCKNPQPIPTTRRNENNEHAASHQKQKHSRIRDCLFRPPAARSFQKPNTPDKT